MLRKKMMKTMILDIKNNLNLKMLWFHLIFQGYMSHNVKVLNHQAPKIQILNFGVLTMMADMAQLINAS